MKAGRLEAHLRVKHPENLSAGLEYFMTLKEKFEKRLKVSSLFNPQKSLNVRTLEASYEISLLIAKNGKNHTIGEKLIKPAISIFMKIVQQLNDEDVRAMPLSLYTVSARIDERGRDIELQLIDKLKVNKFSLQLDESTIRDSEALLLAYVRFIENGAFHEEMLFCASFETTAMDIYNKVKHYFNSNAIPIENLLSCAADGAPAMMGIKNGCLKLLKDENPTMLIIHCVIHRENLIAKKLSPVLHDILRYSSICGKMCQ